MIDQYSTRPCGASLMEVVGVAGSGKSTVARMLAERLPGLGDGLRLARHRHPLRFAVTAIGARAQGLLRQSRRSREGWGCWKDWRYLDAFTKVATSAAVLRYEGILFDQGPLYRLTRLKLPGDLAAGRACVESEGWGGALRQWSQLLDLVVMLDAPNEILLDRVLHRKKQHLIHQFDTKRAFAFFDDFRTRFRDVLSLLTRHGAPRVVWLDTERLNAEEVTAQVLIEYESLRTQSPPLRNAV